MSKCVVTDNIDVFVNAMEEQIARGLEECGMDAVHYAVNACPVDTGRLQNSITYVTNEYSGKGTYTDKKGNAFSDATAKGSVDKYTMVVGTNVEYAEFVECGTHTRKAKPYT